MQSDIVLLLLFQLKDNTQREDALTQHHSYPTASPRLCLTKGAQRLSQTRSTQSPKSDTHNVVKQEDGGGGDSAASALRCRQATFTPGTAVTLQHNGLLIEAGGNRRVSFHQKHRQVLGFVYHTSVKQPCRR